MDRVRVLLMNADMGGCGHYRMVFPYEALRHDPNLEITLGDRPYIATDHDVVVIHRTMKESVADAIPELQRRGIAVVVEIDDDYWDVDTRNPAYQEGRNRRDIHIDHLTRACQLADMVTVSTPRLAKITPNRVTRVLRNCVPESYLTLKRDAQLDWSVVPSRPLVGWTGSLDYHPGDLKVPGNSTVASVTRQTGASFMGIGDLRIGMTLGYEDGESIYTEWVPFARYPSVIKGFDIGLVPLEDNNFNQSKSWLKGLEYSSLGIPFVASPRAEYRELHARGAGVLADKPRDWMRELRRLIVDEEYRAHMGETAREFARTQTYELHAHLWAEAWLDALAIRRGT